MLIAVGISLGHIIFQSGTLTHSANEFYQEMGGVEEVVSVFPPIESGLGRGGAFYREGAFFSYQGAGGTDPVSPVVVGGMAFQEPLIPLTIESSANTRTDVVTYAVKAKDNPSTIAAEFGITTQTLLWANHLKEGDFIQPGDALIILPVTGVRHAVVSKDTVSGIAKKYRGEIGQIIAFNNLPADGSLHVGDIIIIPDGELPSPRAARIRSYPRYGNLPALRGYFMYPTTGRNWGRIHGNNAVDIANACGTPIRAAASGRVVLADGRGWNYGYGKYITIVHPNRTQTLYAHLSRILVSYGEMVERGDIIGMMGSTGRSTGCHLHFEVHGARNPLAR